MNKIVGLVLGVILVLVAIIAVSSSTYSVQNGTVAMVSHFGKFEKPITSPGLHFRNPITESVHLYDVRMHTVNYSHGNNHSEVNGIITEPSLTVMDSKNVSYQIELTIQYTPVATKMKQILTDYGSNYYDKLIAPIVYDIARDVGGNYNVATISDHRAEITAALHARLSAAFKGFPVILNGVQLRGIDLPSQITKQILAVQVAQQELNRLQNVEAQAEEQRKITQVNADAAKIKTVTAAQAEAQATLLKAQAQAKGNILLSRSVTPTLVAYIRANRWNGALPQFTTGGSNGGLGFLMKMPALSHDARNTSGN